jgi:hypothetical protein
MPLGRCCRYSRALPWSLQGSSRSCARPTRRSVAERHSTRRCILTLPSRGRGRICSWIWARWTPRDAAHKECERVQHTPKRLATWHTANTSSRVIASSFAGSSDATLSRVGTRAQCFVFQLFADRIGIDRYRITPPRQAEARPLKHLKHETSTKHQCGATIRLEVTILVRLTQVGSWFRNSVTQVKEPAGHRRMSRIDVIDNRVVSLVTLRRRPRSDGFRRASSGLDHGIGASANRPGRWRLVS